MNSSYSLAGRAVLAVVLMIGFYLLAIAIAAGLLYIPYAELTYAHRLHIKLTLICVVGSLAILWSVLPRPDKFEAPGPTLSRDDHPALFAELEGVAASVHQTMPAEVYLVPDVNAWVAQRGGIMGFGSRRVMGLGLPLMQVLTRSQFRAVLAHEFGHYHGGDTKLGPWIYKTRNAIGRTLASLGDGSWLQMPFLWYGKMFLRITHAVSRRQEFVADELAARAVGSQPLIGGLRTIHGVAPAFNAYWLQECAPVLDAGYRPPFTEGFRHFVQAEPIAKAINEQLNEELKTGKADPYDTHPPLKERIAAVEHLPAGDVGPEDRPATTLLTDLGKVESRLMASLFKPDFAEKLEPIDWQEVSARVYLPNWTALTRANLATLSGVTPESLPQRAADLKAFAGGMRTQDGGTPPTDQAEGLATAVVGSALTLLLSRRGGRIQSLPGQPVSVVFGAVSFEPFAVLRSLAHAELSAEAWHQQCADLGILGVDLGQVAKAGEGAA
ncbi:MAG: M48 family metallopeptidase [Verrucomicrobiales bacterium]|nr:M48 family metallopeptidase [Verrucomicrobiales bacterium]